MRLPPQYALRRLNQAPKRTPARKPGRASRYACPEVMAPLRAIWLATDQMASKRLKAAMPLWLPHYEAGILVSRAYWCQAFVIVLLLSSRNKKSLFDARLARALLS